ncbi:MAG: methyltransferase domain-containing protein [Bacteroidota bacterium]
MSNKVFVKYADVYDLFNAQKNYRLESERIITKLTHYTDTDISSITEFGCGSCKHALHFRELGVEKWVGVDQSAELLAVNERKLPQTYTTVNSTISNFTPDQKSEAVISLFHVFSYLTKNKEINNFFATASKCVQPGGILYFDCWFTPAVFHALPEQRIKEINVGETTYIRFATPEIDIQHSVVHVNYEFLIIEKDQTYRFSETHSMRSFAIPEVELIAESHGFELIEVEQLLTKSKPSLETWDLGFLLRKTDE